MAWLNDCGRWRSEHRRTLATLARVEASIMEQEAALESHVALIRSHDMHLQQYGLTESRPGEPEYEVLDREDVKFHQKHPSVREAHERLKKHHISILSEVEQLLKMCESAM
jgi:hypothetical protein